MSVNGTCVSVSLNTATHDVKPLATTTGPSCSGATPIERRFPAVISRASHSVGPVPIECPNGFHMLDPQNALNTFEVDVSRFVPESATQLTLAQFGKDLTEDQKAWFKGAELPERYRIEIVDNRKVVLKARCAAKGLAVSIR